MFAALAMRVNIDGANLQEKEAFDKALLALQFGGPFVVFSYFVAIGGLSKLLRRCFEVSKETKSEFIAEVELKDRERGRDNKVTCTEEAEEDGSSSLKGGVEETVKRTKKATATVSDGEESRASNNVGFGAARKEISFGSDGFSTTVTGNPRAPNTVAARQHRAVNL